MTAKTVDKKKFTELAEAIIAGGHRLYGPIRNNGEVTLTEVTEQPEFDFSYRNFKTSPKDFFLPQSEVICRFCRGELVEDAVSAPQKRVLLGLRPCDARAFWLMDKVFLEEPEDFYYKQKRENTVIIAAACANPESTCFCTSVGGGPAGTEGSDVLLFDVGERFLFEAVTERGENFLNQFPEMNEDATKKQIAEKEKIAEESSARIEKLALDGIAERFAESFDSDLWEEPSQKCLGCGICTYFCPTCYCFDVTDETLRENGRRVRTWDSCMYKLFTLHASGHNPRPTQKERIRQRFMHKFSYSVDNHGELFCVGCGRCIKNCPVNLDLREVFGSFSKRTLRRPRREREA